MLIRWLVSTAGVNHLCLSAILFVTYLCALRHDRFDPGTETMEAQLFAEEDIPWDEIAFLTVRHTLQNYFEDRRRGAFGVHSMDFSVKDFPPDRKPAG